MTQGNRVARNVAVSIANQIVTWMLSFWVTIKLPEYLGASGLGQFALASSVAGLCAMVITLGTSTVLVREIARDHGRASDLVAAALGTRVPLSIIAVIICVVASQALHYSHRVMGLVVIAEGAIVMSSFNDALGAALQGLEQIPKQNLGQFVERLIASIGTVVLLLAGAPMWALLGISIVSNACAFVLNVILVLPYVPRIWFPSIASMRDLVRAGLPFATTTVFSSLYSQCDAPILNQLATVSMIGWYNLGRRLLGAVLFLPVALTGALLPTLSRLNSEDPDAFTSTLRRMTNLVLVAAVPFTALLLFGPRQVLAILHCQKGFGGSIPVLQIFGVGFIAWYLSQVVGAGLIASDRQAALSRITGLAALVSAPLCAALVAAAQALWRNGAVGAAAGDVMVECYLLVSYVRASMRSPLDTGSVAVFLKSAAAAVPLALLLIATRSVASTGMIVLAGAAGAIAYVPLTAALKCWDPQDLSMIRGLAAHRARK